MKVYRVTFVANPIASIKRAEPTLILRENEDSYYENGGVLVYALIKAESEEEARKKALAIIAKVKGGRK